MKGTLTFVIVAAIATWAFLFFPLDKDLKGSRPVKSPDVAQDATPRPSEPVPRPNGGHVPESGPAAATTATPERAAAPLQAISPGNSSGPAGRDDAKLIGAAQPGAAPRPQGQTPSAAPFDPDTAPATGELAEGVLSPDYKLAEESYVQEPRDGPWASRHEAAIRDALYNSELREDVVIVHCQSTVCRIHINPRGGDPFAELARVPGLAAAAGIDSSTPYSLNGSELIVYARPEDSQP